MSFAWAQAILDENSLAWMLYLARTMFSPVEMRWKSRMNLLWSQKPTTLLPLPASVSSSPTIPPHTSSLSHQEAHQTTPPTLPPALPQRATSGQNQNTTLCAGLESTSPPSQVKDARETTRDFPGLQMSPTNERGRNVVKSSGVAQHFTCRKIFWPPDLEKYFRPKCTSAVYNMRFEL